MTHRSVGVFIILAALLVAVPQASRDLLNLAGEAGDQARSAVLRAFLGLNAGSAVAAPARKDSATLVASCQSETEGRQSAPRTIQVEGRARLVAQPEAAADEKSLEMAMILDEPDQVPVAPASTDMGVKIEDFEFTQTPAPLLKDAVGLSELAMIIPPDASIPPPVAVKGQWVKAGTALRNAGEVNRELRAATLFAAKTALLRAEAADVRRAVYAVRKHAEAEAARGEVRVKARMPVSAPKNSAEPIACGAPQFVKVAALAVVAAPVALATDLVLGE
jgi:hypothetical protein